MGTVYGEDALRAQWRTNCAFANPGIHLEGMEAQDLYLRFIVALGIGLVVGIERGWSQRDVPDGQREAGVRTFTILALTGFAAGVGAQGLGPWFPAAIAVGVLTLLAIGYAGETRQEHADRGLTTETAALLTFVLGALAGIGELLAAGVTAVVMVAVLEQKDTLHGALQQMQRFELTAGVKLLLVSVVLLPVLPNEGFGPGAVLNPYELWWAVVVIAAIGTAGYAAIKIAGPERGAFAIGLTGGLVSSTGVTVNAARASKEAPENATALVGAIATAQSVMFVRTFVLIAVMNAGVLTAAVLPLAAGLAVSLVCAWIFVGRATTGAGKAALSAGSPDALMAAIQFIVVVACVLLLAHYARIYAGDIGLVVSGLLSGALDVDAATVSAARLAGTGADAASPATAMAAITAAIVANSLVKSGIAFSMGARALAWPAIGVLIGSAVAAVAGVMLADLLPK